MKPLWRRVAKRWRDRAYRLASLGESLARRSDGPPTPPLHLRVSYYGTARVSAYAHASQCARSELLSRGLLPHHRVLDIGCGIGNLAVGLTDYLTGDYVGFDINPEAIAWCQRVITSRHPTFRFCHADLSSNAYNAAGRFAPSAYRFPLPDRSVDVVFLGSVFTHLLPDAAEQYVHEIGRLLAPEGMCVASYFLLNDMTRTGVDNGDSFLSFPFSHPSGLCRLHDEAIPEYAVALDESFVTEVHARAGLRIRDIRRGGWWRGQRHDQDVVTADRSIGAAGPSSIVGVPHERS